MARLEMKDTIKINEETHKINVLLKTLIYLPSHQLLNWFETIGLSVPRQIRINVLKNVLRESVIKTRIERKTLADELNYRLSWFNEYTETQLENLLVFYDDDSLDKTFYELLWLEFLNYFVSKEVPHARFQELIDLSIDHVKENGLKLENSKTFNRTLSPIFFDRKNEIDGLPLEKIRPVLYKSSTIVEIRELGKKYGVDVPKRLRKNELADIIVQVLKDREQHSDEEEAKVRSMSILVLQRYAIDNDIKASTELKKEETIEYILKYANETKETYFVPETSDVYETELNDKTELPDETPAVEEVKVEEPVIEDVIELVEETVVEKEVVHQVMDVSELVEEIRLLRKAIESKETNVFVEQPEKAAEPVAEKVVDENEFDPKEVAEVHLETVTYNGPVKLWKKVDLEALDDYEEVEVPVEKKDHDTSDLPRNFELIIPKKGEGKTDIVELNFFKRLLKFLMWLLIIAVMAVIIYGVIGALFGLNEVWGPLDKVVELFEKFIPRLK